MECSNSESKGNSKSTRVSESKSKSKLKRKSKSESKSESKLNRKSKSESKSKSTNTFTHVDIAVHGPSDGKHNTTSAITVRVKT